MALYLAEGIRMRSESFGGLLFHPSSGATIDVDKEAYSLLSLLKKLSGLEREDLYRRCNMLFSLL